MKRFLLISLGALALGLAIASSANAATDYFLKLDGIDGESSSAGHEGSLAIESYSFGASQAGSWTKGGGASVGRAAAPAADPPAGSGALTVSKKYDKASPQLFTACATGQHIKSAQLTRCEDGACKVYELKNIMVSSMTLSNDGKGNVTEESSLRYHEWRWLDASASGLRESPTRQSLGTAPTLAPPKPK